LDHFVKSIRDYARGDCYFVGKNPPGANRAGSQMLIPKEISDDLLGRNCESGGAVHSHIAVFLSSHI
jgi:hypothetical protein